MMSICGYCLNWKPNAHDYHGKCSAMGVTNGRVQEGTLTNKSQMPLETHRQFGCVNFVELVNCPICCRLPEYEPIALGYTCPHDDCDMEFWRLKKGGQ